jgi:hypothetical protein
MAPKIRFPKFWTPPPARILGAVLGFCRRILGALFVFWCLLLPVRGAPAVVRSRILPLVACQRCCARSDNCVQPLVAFQSCTSCCARPRLATRVLTLVACQRCTRGRAATVQRTPAHARPISINLTIRQSQKDSDSRSRDIVTQEPHQPQHQRELQPAGQRRQPHQQQGYRQLQQQ